MTSHRASKNVVPTFKILVTLFFKKSTLFEKISYEIFYTSFPVLGTAALPPIILPFLFCKIVISLFFDTCTSLETINLPSTTERFDLSGLTSLKSLKAINVESGASGPYSSFNGILCKEKELVFCPIGYQGSVHIPSSVNSIRKDALRGCDGITDVLVDEGVSSINASAFQNCSMLKKVVLPNTVTNIGESAFKGCLMLESVSLGTRVKSITTSLFEDCSMLKEIVLPGSIGVVGGSAFKNCFSLEKIVFGEGIKEIQPDAFSFCSSLREINLPSTLAQINEKAFMGCESLTRVQLPQHLKEIGAMHSWAVAVFLTLKCQRTQKSMKKHSWTVPI